MDHKYPIGTLIYHGGELGMVIGHSKPVSNQPRYSVKWFGRDHIPLHYNLHVVEAAVKNYQRVVTEYET